MYMCDNIIDLLLSLPIDLKENMPCPSHILQDIIMYTIHIPALYQYHRLYMSPHYDMVGSV